MTELSKALNTIIDVLDKHTEQMKKIEERISKLESKRMILKHDSSWKEDLANRLIETDDEEFENEGITRGASY